MVVSAQAWHWVDLEIRYRKAHLVLAPQASLALIWNRPFAPDGEQPLLRAKVAAAYRELAPDLNPALPGERAQDRLPEIEASGLFRSLEHERRTWGVTYSAEGWLGLLRTQSDHRLLPPGQLEALLRRLRAALEEAGGSMPTTYENHLYLGRRND